MACNGHVLVVPASFVRRFGLQEATAFAARIEGFLVNRNRVPDFLIDDVFGDGSARDPEDPEIWRAAWAVVRRSGRTKVVVSTGYVAGSCQTVPRAELTALVAALPVSRDLVFHSDCNYLGLWFRSASLHVQAQC